MPPALQSFVLLKTYNGREEWKCKDCSRFFDLSKTNHSTLPAHAKESCPARDTSQQKQAQKKMQLPAPTQAPVQTHPSQPHAQPQPQPSAVPRTKNPRKCLPPPPGPPPPLFYRPPGSPPPPPKRTLPTVQPPAVNGSAPQPKSSTNSVPPPVLPATRMTRQRARRDSDSSDASMSELQWFQSSSRGVVEAVAEPSLQTTKKDATGPALYPVKSARSDPAQQTDLNAGASTSSSLAAPTNSGTMTGSTSNTSIVAQTNPGSLPDAQEAVAKLRDAIASLQAEKPRISQVLEPLLTARDKIIDSLAVLESQAAQLETVIENGTQPARS
ncbi:unnamed protein product [Tilletia laevis]|uniref:Uncharacterized protein n=2 Tax=Tilletia TaxID=13289 RepID=A0A8X7SW32_9BASI|nr:hypothetical protein CF336_g5300 [Tilletia laevis]KAE8193881.1 hypothetical protein CF328_g4910 [Tilletia controversa]KAE8246087.1 hypothetical protein A4X06_0g5199 [Tilletia controversa]CAD6955828.1 unnamed protein product [Tilletia laevis]CAD6972281.1 unnamed protein product [Tilletia controversa]